MPARDEPFIQSAGQHIRISEVLALTRFDAMPTKTVTFGRRDACRLLSSRISVAPLISFTLPFVPYSTGMFAWERTRPPKPMDSVRITAFLLMHFGAIKGHSCSSSKEFSLSRRVIIVIVKPFERVQNFFAELSTVNLGKREKQTCISNS